MKNYNLKPWELNDLTLTECSLMLLALREDDDNSIKEGDDPSVVAHKQQRLQRILEENYKYNQLSPEQKLTDALREYRR